MRESPQDQRWVAFMRTNLCTGRLILDLLTLQSCCLTASAVLHDAEARKVIASDAMNKGADRTGSGTGDVELLLSNAPATPRLQLASNVTHTLL